MFLRRGIAAVGGLAALPLLAGCQLVPGMSGKSAPGVSQKMASEIDFVHIHSGVAGEAVDALVKAYHEKQNQVKVNPVFVQGSYEGVLEKLQAQAAAKQLPALTQGGFTYTRFMIKNMPLTPVSKFIEAEKMDTSDFAPAMLKLGQDDNGQQWGMPLAVSTPIFYVNTEHFKEAGLDPEKDGPKTWDDVRRLAKTLTKGDRAGIFYHYDITGNWLFQAMVETAGGKMISDDGSKVAFHEEPGQRSLAFWNALVNEDGSMPRLGWQQARQSFVAGAISMVVTTTAELQPLTRDSGKPLKTYPFPLDGKNPRRVPAGGNNVYIIGQNPDQQAAAWDFIKFAASPEGTTIVAKGTGYMATRKSAVTQADLMGNFLKEYPNAQTSYDQLDQMVPWYNFPGRSGTKIYKVVQDNIVAALNKEKAPKLALDEAAEEATKLIRE